MFDLVLKNGLLLDGSGKEGYVADVAVKDGVYNGIRAARLYRKVDFS